MSEHEHMQRVWEEIMEDKVVCATAAAVMRDIRHRAEFGLTKYGVTVANSPLSEKQWLQHAYEETLDLAVYLRRILDEAEVRPE